jgi:hypothetical protein
MSQFDIDHGGFEALNQELKNNLVQLGDVLQGFTAAMGGIAGAAKGDAAELWKNEHQHWVGVTNQIEQDLAAHTSTSFNVHEIFVEGDNRATRVFG